jgi:hypothetical protein
VTEVHQAWGKGPAPAQYRPLPVRPGVTAAELAAAALVRCTHTKRQGFGREVLACQPCEQVVLYGREAVVSGAALPTSIDPVCRTIHGFMADGGERTLNAPDDDGSIVATLNRIRAEHGQQSYGETATSARIRDLRKAGYSYVRGRTAGRVTYRYVAPE